MDNTTTSIKKAMKNSYLDAIEAKDTLRIYLQEMMDTSHSPARIEAAMKELNGAFQTIQNHWFDSRSIEELLKLMNENKSLEVNEDEYMLIREFYEMHNTGFILEEVNYDDSYFRIAKLENR